MRIDCLKSIALSVTFILSCLGSLVQPWSTLAADPGVVQAKKEAEAKGYIFFTTHDEIVAMAKKEAKLRVMSGLEPPNFGPWINAFKQKYPFMDASIEEIGSQEARQKFILEMKAGQAKEWDVIHIPIESAPEYPPYLMKHDVLGMAAHGVLKIHPKMIHPIERNMISVTSAITVVPYNTKLISEDKVPSRWEDFLKPEFKGKKFIVDIRSLGLAGMVPLWGLESTLEFARKLAAQQPTWAVGGNRITGMLSTGEYSFGSGSNFSTVKRAMNKNPTGVLNYKIVEPLPVRVIGHSVGILNTTPRPHAALLWLEFLASPEGQQIIDKYEPLTASVLTPGSVNEQMSRGKELSVVDWNHSIKFEEYMEKIVAAFGFPKADK